MTDNETTTFGVTQDGQTVVEPFDRDASYNLISVGKSRGGSTSFSTKHQRLAEMFEDEGGDES